MSDLLQLHGKDALVTGGSRGVGRATARLLAKAGARSVGIAFRSRVAEAAAAVDELRGLGARAWHQAGDLTRVEEVEALFARADDECGGLDIVVVNHGVWPPHDVPLARMSDEQWHQTLGANLHSVFYVCRAAVGRLREGGRLVLVGSTAGQRGEAFHADYAATKGAMIAFVKGLCVELAPRDVTVNCVAPGWIDTDMTADTLAVPGARERVEGQIPLGRVASADDIAGPIVFLCSPLARHVTGEILNVNGGAVLVG